MPVNLARFAAEGYGVGQKLRDDQIAALVGPILQNAWVCGLLPLSELQFNEMMEKLLPRVYKPMQLDEYAKRKMQVDRERAQRIEQHNRIATAKTNEVSTKKLGRQWIRGGKKRKGR